jgi:uncharacterized protein (DUF849 family)
MLITAAINGSRSKAEHSHIPVTSVEIATAAAEAADEGRERFTFTHAQRMAGRFWTARRSQQICTLFERGCEISPLA